ncbi:MAG: NAD+ synthase [Armatimonadetes bacterium CG2_30_59_28]|nr:NAD+ synthase [Armatimonadota bacterium]OIO92412.1 MAG: NAD+ synthase [Armatimonadetes bacterium CG2_30_59_28]PIU63689.1 MAG: NAD+ synthase [Armatimonadetes bacterium CG07_land_8_20_14_0_80_59_28]PIX43996.1 MAG: NAD+ synthase [Armatimonadetes bacterium CG_4_8_14_3_um_filter_58_9]
MRIALAQINTTVGALDQNTNKVIAWMARAREHGVDIVVFPELAITGYPPEDLLLKPRFIDDNLACLESVAQQTGDVVCVVGFVDRSDDVYNAAAIMHKGSIVSVHHKHFLPNYGVFDENRYFQAGTDIEVVSFGSARIGVSICEDIWYPGPPMTEQALLGDADLIVNISASPYHAGKGVYREHLLATRATDNATVVALCNLVGGQDELVFDGQSMIVDQDGKLLCRGKQFEEDLLIVDLDLGAVFRRRLHDPRRRKEKLLARQRGAPVPKEAQIEVVPSGSRERGAIEAAFAPRFEATEEIYHALVLGTRDYVRKNGFEKVVLGLSGGIDSSLTAAIAVDALGAENVIGVIMPSQFSSDHSKDDARALAENLGIRLENLPIQSVFESYIALLADKFEGLAPNQAEENIQARIRGNLLMALSNKFGWLVLATGNKSENSVGYCTLYGDMSGGLCIVKDVPKMTVYDLAILKNRQSGRAIIPQNVLDKPPSAELRPDQKDADSLPAYVVLDQILKAYVEEDRSVLEIAASGFDEALVRDVVRMVDRNEYKRRQASPGIKITPRAFGKDRRLPITNAYVEKASCRS